MFKQRFQKKIKYLIIINLIHFYTVMMTDIIAKARSIFNLKKDRAFQEMPP